MDKKCTDLTVYIGGDYSLTTYYHAFLKKNDISGKRSILYPLKKLRDLFSKGFTILNLECTLYLNYFQKVPKTEPAVYLEGHPSTAGSLNYGNVDAVSLANNHSFDGGSEGLKETIKILNDHHIGIVGVGKSLEQAFGPTFFKHDGYEIAVIAVNNVYSESCIDAPLVTSADDMAVASINLDESNSHKLIQSVARSISLAKEKKSDVIMVYYHWGAEHVERVTDEQIRIAVQTAEAGADIVVGTHQHFVQGIRRYVTSDGRTVPLCFGLGHVVFGAIPNPKEKWSIILECVFQRDSKTGRMLLKGAQSIPIVTDPTFTKDDAFQPYSCMGIKRRRFLNLLRRRSASIALPR